MNGRIRILLGSSAALLALLLLSVIRDCTAGRSVSVTTALLNPKYRASVAELRVGFAGGGELHLRADGGAWLLSCNGVTMPADGTVVTQLLDALAALRQLPVVAQDARSAQRLGFGQDPAELALYAADGTELSAVQFVLTGQGRLYVRGSRAGTVCGIPFGKDSDFFASYVQPGLQAWAEPLLLPVRALGLTGDVQSVNGAQPEDDFLLRARHGPVLEAPFVPQGEAIFVLNVELGGGGRCVLRFYAADGSGDFYVAVPEFFADVAAGGGRLALDYAVTVSSWTYGRLMESAGAGQ